MAPPPPLVALNAATVAFGGVALFEALSIGLSRGERACLVGRNGSGKSTLLKLLAGLIEPDAGERFVGIRVPQNALGQIGCARTLRIQPMAASAVRLHQHPTTLDIQRVGGRSLGIRVRGHRLGIFWRCLSHSVANQHEQDDRRAETVR